MAVNGNEPLSVGNVAAALGVSVSSGSTGDKPISAENLKAVLSKSFSFDLESASWSEINAMSENVNSGNVDIYRSLFKGCIGKEKTIALSQPWGFGGENYLSSTTLHAVCIDVCKDVDVNGKPCLFTFFIRPRTFLYRGNHLNKKRDYSGLEEREYLNDPAKWFGYIQDDLRAAIKTVPRKYWANYGRWEIATINEKLSIPSMAELGVAVPDSIHTEDDGTVYEWLAKHRGLLFGGRRIQSRTTATKEYIGYYGVLLSGEERYSPSDEEADEASKISVSADRQERVTPIFCI